ncbi:hypothetical protein LTR78_000451 [Recurvomyces mirabilis]|uniref:Uncharacterized protein n=1 Tax=Recurvomyces mirabilis TaxID=574656 RepID=A0AAE1C6K0_9PEZI|nr:hypothetical protein LTR78_000451 [Recurvomyces mirabilis]KAK5162106.1 hypothetical protein LTS14_000452 [Recurvomyces mirabilis]
MSWPANTTRSRSYTKKDLTALPQLPVPKDIVVPAHLLSLTSDRQSWNPNREYGRESSSEREDSRDGFDVTRIAQRQHSILHQARQRARSTTAERPAYLRNTSLPIVPGRSLQSLIQDDNDKFAVQSRKRRSAPPVPTIPPVHLAPERAILFERLDAKRTSRASRTSQVILPDQETDAAQSESECTGEEDPFSAEQFIVPDFGSRHTSCEYSHGGDLEAGRREDGDSLYQTTSIVRRITTNRSVQVAKDAVSGMMRKSSMHQTYEKAKARGEYLQRKKWVQYLFEYTVYALLLCFIYFVLVGLPLWRGAVWWFYWVVATKFVVSGTWSITIGLAAFYAYAPLLIQFEKEPPMPGNVANIDPAKTPGVHNTALLIPCYKSANIIGPTLQAALKIFAAHHIYVIANGNSPTPLDNTEEVCQLYGVNHIWSPVGSKIVAQFVGCYAAKQFENALLIDDDCALPANFPIVSERLSEKVKVIGYTIKSVGPDGSRGTLCQQAQDIEYKISGLQRAFAGMIGSATFPHGAISLWNTKFLIQTFHTHPGFSVSEDWFFGHAARKLGSRIKMCTAIFVETETPSAIFFAGGGSRGGFGEMTIFKQRFFRWNFFFVNGIWFNLSYIFGSWKLGWWEIGAKLFVFQEVYETLLYLLAPFVVPISFVVKPAFCGYQTLATIGLYYVNVTIFNEIHLRRRNERVGFIALYVYYTGYKMVLTGINILSCYWSLFKHPKVIEDERAVEVVLRLEDATPPMQRKESLARQMHVTAVGARINSFSKNSRLSTLSIQPGDVAAEARLTRTPGASGIPTMPMIPSVPVSSNGSVSDSRGHSIDGDHELNEKSSWYSDKAPSDPFTAPEDSEVFDFATSSGAPITNSAMASNIPARPDKSGPT